MRTIDTEVVAELRAGGFLAPEAEALELRRASEGAPARARALLDRRLRGEPLAWVTGGVTWCRLRLAIDPGVFVPRPQTEILARRAATHLPAGGVAVDLCTGSGAVAVFLRHRVPDATVLGTELDAAVARCARRNGVRVLEGSLDDPLPSGLAGRVDVMTAVVPYVPTDAMGLLPRDVRAFEPRLALDGGERGMELLVAVVDRSTRWLHPGAWLVVELGADQVDPIVARSRQAGFDHADVLRDGDGDPRAVAVRLGAGPAQSSGVT
jgi:release factor glutamine methyltransferase